MSKYKYKTGKLYWATVKTYKEIPAYWNYGGEMNKLMGRTILVSFKNYCFKTVYIKSRWGGSWSFLEENLINIKPYIKGRVTK